MANPTIRRASKAELLVEKEFGYLGLNPRQLLQLAIIVLVKDFNSSALLHSYYLIFICVRYLVEISFRLPKNMGRHQKGVDAAKQHLFVAHVIYETTVFTNDVHLCGKKVK